MNLYNLQNKSFFSINHNVFLLIKILLNKYSCQKNSGYFWWKNKNPSKILKKNRPRSKKTLENRQLELSWLGGKVSKNKPCLYSSLNILLRFGLVLRGKWIDKKPEGKILPLGPKETLLWNCHLRVQGLQLWGHFCQLCLMNIEKSSTKNSL